MISAPKATSSRWNMAHIDSDSAMWQPSALSSTAPALIDFTVLLLLVCAATGRKLLRRE